MNPTTPTTQTTPPTWTITTTEGITLTGHQPDWSQDNPSHTDITLNQAINHLREHAHYTMLPVDPVLPPATFRYRIVRTPGAPGRRRRDPGGLQRRRHHRLGR